MFQPYALPQFGGQRSLGENPPDVIRSGPTYVWPVRMDAIQNP